MASPGRLASGVAERAVGAVLEEWRASPLYRRTLRAAAPADLVAIPQDLRSGDPETGLLILNGVFSHAAQTMEVGAGGDPWDRPCPSRRFARGLHEFRWLRHLAALQGDAAAAEARRLFDGWLAVFGRGNVFSWAPDIAGTRLINLLCAAPMLFSGEDADDARTARLAGLAEQALHVARSAGDASPGRPRLHARSAAALAAICLDWPADRRDRLLSQLEREAEAQVLADGGHVSRSPEAALDTLQDLVMVRGALTARGLEAPAALARVIARTGPMVRFFRHGDGKLAAFNGGGEGDPVAVTGALAQTPGGAVFSTAPASVFLRAHAGQSLLILDGGGRPPERFTQEAHAGALSFEFSHGAQRLIVNCGWSANQPQDWRAAARATAAHSTLAVEETSSARLPRGRLSPGLLGGRFAAGARSLESRMRVEEDHGRWMEAAHDGYRAAFGLVHRRRLYLAADGEDLRGEDLLFRPLESRDPKPLGGVDFAIRFHLHPSLRVSLARDESSALIAPPSGQPWRLRTDHGPLRVERSVYLAEGAPPRRCEQLVIYGAAKPGAGPEEETNRVRWALQRM